MDHARNRPWRRDLFDVDLQLAALSAREARRQTRAETRAGRRVGLSRGAIESMQEEAPAYAFSPDSEPARILADCLAWPASEWMSLSRDRRLFLFEHAERAGGDRQALRRISLAVIDTLIDERRGEEVESWIAHRVSADDSTARELIWEGARGQRLLSLDRDTGFRERSVIALHRGVHLLESGDLPGALRSMAYALESAHESRAADAVQSLSRRWLSFVASQFEVTDELLAMLQALAPRRDYSVILEGLGALGLDGSARDAASTLAPSSEVFAGSVRLAPSDPLPWPFRAPAVEAPSIFSPLDLSPVEWRDRSGALVFGWRIGE